MPNSLINETPCLVIYFLSVLLCNNVDQPFWVLTEKVNNQKYNRYCYKPITIRTHNKSNNHEKYKKYCAFNGYILLIPFFADWTKCMRRGEFVPLIFIFGSPDYGRSRFKIIIAVWATYFHRHLTVI